MKPASRQALLALSLLALAASSPGCAWFLFGGVAAGILALQGSKETATELNDPHGVVLGTPNRIKDSPAMISYTLLDPEGSDCTVGVEFSLNGGGSWSAATQGAGATRSRPSRPLPGGRGTPSPGTSPRTPPPPSRA